MGEVKWRILTWILTTRTERAGVDQAPVHVRGLEEIDDRILGCLAKSTKLLITPITVTSREG